MKLLSLPSPRILCAVPRKLVQPTLPRGSVVAFPCSLGSYLGIPNLPPKRHPWKWSAEQMWFDHVLLHIGGKDLGLRHPKSCAWDGGWGFRLSPCSSCGVEQKPHPELRREDSIRLAELWDVMWWKKSNEEMSCFVLRAAEAMCWKQSTDGQGRSGRSSDLQLPEWAPDLPHPEQGWCKKCNCI